MTKRKKKRTASDTSVEAGKTKSYIFELLKPIGLVLFTAVSSLLAYILTPFNEVINSIIWEEKVEIISVSQNVNLEKSGLINLDIFIQPQSPAPISGGTIIVDYPKGLLRPNSQSKDRLVMVVPRLTSAYKITDESLVFVAEDIGVGEILVSFRTKLGGNFQSSLPFEITPAKDQRVPTVRDFSGTWNIDLGNIHGHMNIKDVGRTINGEYHLSDGNHGQIEGARDGKTFRVTFYRGSAPSRFFIEGLFDPERTSDLEIKGSAKLLVLDENEQTGWKESEAISFNAIARAR